MTTRLAAAPRNFVLTTAGNTTTAATGIIDTTSSSSPTLTVVSSETTAVDTITTDTNVLPIINATTNDITAVPIETLVTRDSTSLCFNGEEYQFITTEQLQDIMTQKTLVTTAAVTTSAATTTDLQQPPANTSHQQHNPHHQHHLHQEINGQQSPLSLTTTEAATGPTSVHQDEVAVINVVLPMDNADGSSNEAHQATMDTLAAIKEGVVDLAAHHHNHHHTDPEEGNCPQFITVTVSAQDAGQNYQVQYVDAEQLYHANSTQTQISYPFCPLQEYQTHHQTFYTTAGDFNGIADLSINGNGEHGTASIMPYLVPVEENMLLNTSSEDVHSSPQTPNSTSTSAMGSQCLNLITDHDENSMENNEHNHLMGGSNKIASATVKWLSQNYETAEGVSLPRSTLYSHYMQHCQECNIEPVNAASFGKLIRSVFAGLRTRRLGTRGNSKYHYYGIRIKSDSLLKNHEEEKSLQSQKILQHSKHSAAGVVSSSMHNSQSTTSPGKLQSGNTSDSSPTSSSSISSLHTSNRKLSKKIIFKPETFATCSQLLGDGTGAVPCFPLIELDHTFPPEISIQDVDLFRVRYQEHCEKFLEAILNLEFNTIEYLWRDFWQQASDHHHLDKYLSKRKWDFLCLSSTIQKFVQDIDYQFFQNMVDVIIPDVLRSMPNALTQAIRNFASNMEIWLSDCMSGVPEQMIQIKTSTVSAFCQTLRRYTSLNHLAQAAKAVLQNSAQISQMLKDLSRVDFHNVQEQAAWVCQCDPQIVQQFENDFKTTLQQKSSLEQWASWLQMVVDTALQEYQGKPTYPKAARQFLLKWCLYSSMVIRDLTLRSAPSFGSFHLIRLLYDEYMFYLVEHKIAQAQQKTTIAVICDRNERNLNIELDYQLEFINSADTSSSLHSEPEAKRVGAMDSLTGYTILVSVAHTLSRLLSDKKQLQNSKLNILFMIFNGESYDYIGSQRFVYDLENLYFPKPSTHTAPITFDNIEFILDLGTFDDITNIKLHTLSEFPQAKTLLTKLQKYGNTPKYDFNINFQSSVGYQMPPTSAQSFLRKNLSFPAAILNGPPKNRFYHSVYDDGANLKYNYTNSSLDYTKLMGQNDALKYFHHEDVQMKIRNVSAVIAMSLYEMLAGKEYIGEELPSPVLIDEILYCFIKSQNCPLFYAASKPNSFTKLPLIAPNRYISVNRDSQEATIWTYRIMGYLLSQKIPNASQENCTQLPKYWFAGYNKQGECGITTQNFSLALSPAFIIENYNWSSGEYSTWSESTWSSLSSRLFLRPSRTHEIITLTTGIVVFFISFCLIYIISTRSEVLFEDPGPNASTDALNPPTAC